MSDQILNLFQEFLAEDKNLVVYRKSLRPIGQSIKGTILLGQFIYWWNKMEKQGKTAFYKFKEPCNHSLYKKGESWCEELGFTRFEFETALSKIGFNRPKKKKGDPLEKKAIIWYNTDQNRVTWYKLNKDALKLALRKVRNSLYETQEPNVTKRKEVSFPLYTETTTKTTPNIFFSKEKKQDQESCNPKLDSILNSILNNKKYISLRKNTYSDIPLIILSRWIKYGGKVHIRKAKGADAINSMLDELLMDGRNPYCSLVDDMGLKTKKWKAKEIISCIKYFTQDLKKDISNMYFDSFIIKKIRTKHSQKIIPDYSILAKVFPDVPNEIASKRSKRLQEELSTLRPVEKTPHTVFIRAANFISKLELSYQVHNGASLSYHNSLYNVFIKHVTQECNRQDFILGYISGQNWQNEFLSKTLKQNILQKKGE